MVDIKEGVVIGIKVIETEVIVDLVVMETYAAAIESTEIITVAIDIVVLRNTELPSHVRKRLTLCRFCEAKSSHKFNLRTLQGYGGETESFAKVMHNINFIDNNMDLYN